MTYLPTNRLKDSKNTILPFDALIDQLLEKSLPSFDNEMSFGFFNSYDLPKVDIIDREESVDIELEATGIDKDCIDAELEGNILTVSCSPKETQLEEGARYLRKERQISAFTRSFKIPDSCTRSKISVNYNNGLLCISVPKKKPEKSKKIKIL